MVTLLRYSDQMKIVKLCIIFYQDPDVLNLVFKDKKNKILTIRMGDFGDREIWEEILNDYLQYTGLCYKFI